MEAAAPWPPEGPHADALEGSELSTVACAGSPAADEAASTIDVDVDTDLATVAAPPKASNVDNMELSECLAILSCPICLEIYYKPISLSCGHTICKQCLLRSTQLKLLCPVCRRVLSDNVSITAENIVINQLLCELYPDYGSYCAAKFSELAETVAASPHNILWSGPLFAIPLLMVPNQVTTLYLFEHRYLHMFDIAVQGDNKFCIHPSGALGELGMLVEIIFSTRHQSGSITCSVKCLSRCKFVENAVCYRDVPLLRQPLYKIVSKLMEDRDAQLLETELTAELRSILSSLRNLIRRLEPALSTAQRESLRFMYGDSNAALSSTWVQLSFWMTASFRLDEDLKRRLVHMDIAAARVRAIYEFCLQAEILPEPDHYTPSALTHRANSLFAVGREKSHLETTWKIFLVCVAVVAILVAYLVRSGG
jgi:Lon protease-like protein